MQQNNTILVFGGGAIGTAIATQFAEQGANVILYSRHCPQQKQGVACRTLANWDEPTLAAIASTFPEARLAGVVVATGMLCGEGFGPEKSLADINPQHMAEILAVNTVLPALIGRYFLPLLRKGEQAFFAALSARVGSISDNTLGGWYSYRMSKAALNMFIKTASIEVGRRNKNAVVVGLHPGTVDSALSKPFQRSVPAGKLFAPDYSAAQLVQVLQNLTLEQTGKCFDYAGQEVLP